MSPRPPGRPKVNRPTGRKVTLYLLPDVEKKAGLIGAGNLSGGVSAAVRAYRIATQHVQESCQHRGRDGKKSD